jgi:NitT/TauT family transport system substrate-binding protein
MNRRWRRQASTAVAAAVVVAMAGCGGEDSKPAGGGGSGGPTTLKVQETAGVPSAFVGFGISKGIFSKHKLKIQLDAAQGGATAVPALVSGEIQVAGSNVVSLLLAASKGLPIQAIAPGTSAQGAGDKDFGALLAGAKSGVEDARDLEGKTVAVNTLNNIAEVVVKASLEKEGVDPSKVRLTELEFPEMAPALGKGDVDAAFSIEPFVTASVKDGAKVVNYSYVATEPDMQVGAYAVSKKFAGENPDAVENYRAAVAETAEYVTGHEDEFRTFLSEQAKIPPAVAKKIVLPRFTQELNVKSLDNTAKLMQKYGLVSKPVSAEQLLGKGAG